MVVGEVQLDARTGKPDKSRDRKLDGSGTVESAEEKNSPGSRSGVPYTNSAALAPRSGLRELRIPSRTRARFSDQSAGFG